MHAAPVTRRFLPLALTLLLVVGGVLSGCSRKGATDEEIGRGHFPDLTSTGELDWDESAAGGQAGRDGTGRFGFGGTADPETGTTTERYPGDDLPEGRAVPELETIHFAYDSDELRPESIEALQAHVEFLRRNPGLSVLLRGHTDERGTEEYNLALGSRRALSVRDHLVSQGIESERLHTISLGIYEPIALGQDEEAHAQNRRVEFLVFDTDESE